MNHIICDCFSDFSIIDNGYNQCNRADLHFFIEKHDSGLSINTRCMEHFIIFQLKATIISEKKYRRLIAVQ